MPRNVRNFWLTLNVDGRDTPIATGPVAKDGGFTLKVEQRDAGTIVHTLDLDGYVRDDGTITLRVFRGDGTPHESHSNLQTAVAVIETRR